MPELPEAKRARFVAAYGLGVGDAALLAASIELAAFFEAVVAAAPGSAKLAANWINGELMAALNRDGLGIEASRVSPAQLAGLLRRVMDDTISGKLAKQVFELLWSEGGDADTIIDRQGLRQITDSSAIEAVIDQVLAANPDQVAEYRGGKTKVMGFLVGQIMKASAGKANPAQVNELLKRKLQGG
jgi:aspartyl-tRNA(Asn)/glutamyl-tRNA(Gln) amidotransferase subunit B